MFGQTDNHLLLIDVSPKNLTGKQAQELLDSIGITCNKNMIPDDPRSPMDPSGIRLGTPAMTSRGFKEEEFKQVGTWISQVLDKPENKELHSEIKQQILDLTAKFPLYPELN